jgi:hypothetical protein
MVNGDLPHPPVQRPPAELRSAQVPPYPPHRPRPRPGQQRGDSPAQPPARPAGTARSPWRHGPRSRLRNCPVWQGGALANTLAGHILPTTSPGG